MTSKTQYQLRELAKRERLQERKLARFNKLAERAHAARAINQTIKLGR